MLETDMCNNYYLDGTFEKRDLKGFGYNYYVFSSDGKARSTLMGCSGTGTRRQFVFSQSLEEFYNPKLPIVIYLPEDYEVRFRVFTSNGEEWETNNKIVSRKAVKGK
jgi:ecotin